ncbi:toxin-antitoxin system YwqK family antitoxin [Azospirillum sp. TSO22-1]|uniref:toxin-antitoxin system YwqK family antitoxin n=1 Tax=Azospirillum sp. TSO22-1 TaxID=716789 RepID=UPI0011B5EBCC|nr:toxin-antitoxin system YwqK family antitoxin [Azospirillum sp. TSO22-1]
MDGADTSPPAGHTVVEARDGDGRLLSCATIGPDGVPDGAFVAYAPDGAVLMRLVYKAGVPDGPSTIYRDGRPQTEMSYANGALDGAMRGYDPAGRLLTVVRWAAGRRNGLMECFTVDGTPLMTAEYKNDRLDGLVMEYRADGTLRRQASYKADLLDGETVEFHPGGQPAERTVYQSGVAVEGPERFDDPDAPGKKGLLARLMGK